jgi:hypothetical protein
MQSKLEEGKTAEEVVVPEPLAVITKEEVVEVEETKPAAAE